MQRKLLFERHLDIVEVMSSGDDLYFVHSALYSGLQDVRRLQFYPSLKIVPSHIFGEEALSVRYEQMKRAGHLSSNSSVEDLINSQNRLIGGDFDPSRAVLFLDHHFWSGKTLQHCAKEFALEGYDRNRMYFAVGSLYSKIDSFFTEN